jgi:hypothetical protein
MLVQCKKRFIKCVAVTVWPELVSLGLEICELQRAAKIMISSTRRDSFKFFLVQWSMLLLGHLIISNFHFITPFDLSFRGRPRLHACGPKPARAWAPQRVCRAAARGNRDAAGGRNCGGKMSMMAGSDDSRWHQIIIRHSWWSSFLVSTRNCMQLLGRLSLWRAQPAICLACNMTQTGNSVRHFHVKVSLPYVCYISDKEYACPVRSLETVRVSDMTVRDVCGHNCLPTDVTAGDCFTAHVTVYNSCRSD